MSVSNEIESDCFSFDYPVGTFEQLALKKALLEEVQGRERELKREIEALESQCAV
ncbi:hypothetical protein [Alginatibacterium sediminis]|uniref:hypothetical protein n=1 Tax=Alginatibacterium sediminis TaxID=2164068 RepID=UPI001314E7C6|nr:hypothetical protein [Alginatibacterium sediminis]